LFELSTHRQDGTSGVLGQFGELERRWKAWANRSNGAAVLEYQSSHDAPWHKIYGRPRQYLPPTVGGLTKQGRGKAQIAFQQLIRCITQWTRTLPLSVLRLVPL